MATPPKNIGIRTNSDIKMKGNHRNKRKSRVTFSILLSCCMIILLYFFYPTFFIFAVGLLPSLLIYAIDKSSGKSFTKTVCWMNFSAVIVILFQLWTGDNNFQTAVDIISTGFNWMIIIICCLVAWCLHITIPPFVESYLEISYQIKIKSLYEEKRILEEEWGKDVGKMSDSTTLQEVENAYNEMVQREKTKLKRLNQLNGTENNSNSRNNSNTNTKELVI